MNLLTSIKQMEVQILGPDLYNKLDMVHFPHPAIDYVIRENAPWVALLLVYGRTVVGIRLYWNIKER
jgi:hypothetical protein